MRDRAATTLRASLAVAVLPLLAGCPGPGAGSGADASTPPAPATAPIAGTGSTAATGPTAETATRPAPIPGFSPGSAVRQLDLERRFLAVPSPAGARATARALTRVPHLAGTDGVRTTAEHLEAELRRLGFEVTVDVYEPWLPLPGRVSLDVLAPEPRRIPMREPPPPGSTVRSTAPELVHWHAYSGDGVAEGEVVYANYGLPADYAALDALGVDVGGRVVLARMGQSYRGVKAREAERRGAAGLLLFPDPAGDGWAAGDTVPAGPWRPADAPQRGTVMYMSRHTGDPLTPGWAATPGAPRLDPDSATNVPRIPVAPLGYGDAGSLLAALGGPAPPDGFAGALPVEYRPGPGPLRVRLEVRQERAPRAVRNVVARLPGRTDREVILGNHYDAWVLGGVDPHSGTAAMMEIARGLSALTAGGWRPRRGVTLAFWDAEEFGVVGSSEWVEDHLDALRERAVAYLNVDVFTAGVLDVSGSPALRDLVVSAAEAVDDPVTGRTLAEEWRERQATRGGPAAGVAGERRAAGGPGDGEPTPRGPSALPRLGDIGAGSDWTAFLHHAGVPSLQWTMNGRGTYGVYHSALDDFGYLSRFADSAFVHTPAFAGVMGVAALRLAEADALPFRYTAYAERVLEHVEAVEAEHGIRLERERRALAGLARSAARLEEAVERALRGGWPSRATAADPLLPRVEGAFLDPAGLPGRPWYRHVLSAPGRESGYGPLPLPSLAEALDAGDGEAVERAREGIVAAVERGAAVLEEAAERLEGTGDAPPPLDVSPRPPSPRSR